MAATRTKATALTVVATFLVLMTSPCRTVPQLAPCSIPPPDLANGSYVEVKEKRLALYHCNDKFWLSGPDILICNISDDGKDTWLPDPGPECREPQDCPEIDLKNGVREGACCAPGDNVTFYCSDSERFQLLGAEEAICQQNGSWSAPTPTCQDTYCGDPGVSKKGYRLIAWNDQPLHGECCPPDTTIYYGCEDDFDLEGEKAIRCGANATWTHPRPMCRPKESCDNFKVPHGQVSGDKLGGDFYIPGDSAFVTCDRGFRINGTDQLYCEEDGQWDDDVPTCVEYNCTRFEPGPHLQVDEFRDLNKTAFTEGTFINFRCDDGYHLVGAYSIMCQKGYWSARMPKCEQIRCGSLRAPPHSTVTGNSTAVGATAKFSCFHGYVLLGSRERECGSDGQWDGTPARCVNKAMAEANVGKVCLDPGTPDNGIRVGRSNFLVGTKVTFACNHGYHMRGSAMITCLTNGKWSSQLPRCIGKFYYDKTRLVGRTVNAMTSEIPKSNTSARNDNDGTGRAINVRDPNAERHFVYFLFDASTSIGPKNFKTGVKLAKAITRKVNVTKDGHRVGAIVFTKDARLVIDPTAVFDQNTVLKKLEEINHTTGGTSISKALQQLKINVASAKGTTQGKIRVAAFLISDGKANIGGDAYKEAEYLNRSRVDMYCIGITGQRDDNALRKLASKEENVFILRDFDALQWLADIITSGTIDYSECGLSYSHDPLTGFDIDDFSNSSAVGRILGGETVKTVWPWMVQINIYNRAEKKFQVACGGTIIHRKWILTAAHCMHTPKDDPGYPRNYTPGDLRLLAGLIKTSSATGKKLVVESIVRHEKYNASSYENDIALLKLKDEIAYEKAVRPICLPPLNEKKDKPSSKEGKTAFAIGWGANVANSLKATDNLMQLKMEIGSRAACKKSVTNYADKVYPEQGLMCAKSTEGDTCNGDSGGPLMEGIKDEENVWTQVGIVSWGSKVCQKDKHSFYTDVSHYMEWIKRHVDLSDSVPVANGTARP